MSERSQRILELITKKEISYGQLAKMTGIPKSALQRYATGQTDKIPIDRVVLLAKALGVQPAYLMGWDNASAYSRSSTPTDTVFVASPPTEYKTSPDLFIKRHGGLFGVPYSGSEGSALKPCGPALRVKRKEK